MPDPTQKARLIKKTQSNVLFWGYADLKDLWFLTKTRETQPTTITTTVLIQAEYNPCPSQFTDGP